MTRTETSTEGKMDRVEQGQAEGQPRSLTSLQFLPMRERILYT